MAFAVTRLNFEADRYDSAIWLWDEQGERQFTQGPGDSSPAWSPDGQKLAFLRDNDSEQDQLAVISATGGKPEILTAFELGVAPDSVPARKASGVTATRLPN